VAGTTRAQGPGSTEGDYINWLTFSDNAKSIVEDVTRIRTHLLVPNDIPIYGYIYNLKSGKLIEVPEAMTGGKASEAGTILEPHEQDSTACELWSLFHVSEPSRSDCQSLGFA
jgi:hypothetical protein